MTLNSAQFLLMGGLIVAAFAFGYSAMVIPSLLAAFGAGMMFVIACRDV